MEMSCSLHGIFWQIPASHLSGRGCPKCGLLDLRSQFSKGFEAFVKQAKDVHGNKYEYVGEYVNNKTKLEICCTEHGSFSQTPDNHINGGTGCPKCSLISLGNMRTSASKNEFIQRAREIHGSKYEYIGEYLNSSEKIEIICPVHGSFFQSPNAHLSAKGCHRCSNTSSRPENKWLDRFAIPDLQRQHIIAVKGKRRRLMVDGYDPSTNTVYEFLGDFYHGNPIVYPDPFHWNSKLRSQMFHLYERTLAREKSIKSAGYNYVSIWEHDWNAAKSSPQASSRADTESSTYRADTEVARTEPLTYSDMHDDSRAV